MSFIVGLLFFVLFVLLAGLLFVLVIIMRGVGKIRRFFHLDGRNNRASTTEQQPTYRQTRTSDGVTITDRRSPEEAQKKIFAPEEGEYVEYREEE